MSFDLDIITTDVDGNTIVHEVVCGHTYNLAPMWRKALPALNTTRDLDGRRCSDLLPELTAGLHDMIAKTQEYRELEPSNNWGDYPGFFEIFVRFREMCALYPSGVVEWSG